MKAIYFIIALLVVSFSTNAATFAPKQINKTIPAPMVGKVVILPSSTPIVLTLNEKVIADGLEKGATTLRFKVKYDVRFRGVVLVKAGAVAVGTITYKTNPGSYNSREEIGIEITQVRAVDGTMVNVEGNQEIILGSTTGETPEASRMTDLTCNTIDDTEIYIE